MSLYSILLVDDEEDVFQAIMKKINWEAIGFKVSGYARNGEEALEMTEELVPDVVMSDIKMPYMDGLTLCRKLKERYGNIKVIIFSGFDEFEYAKEAIKLEAEEYILKPINSVELKAVFERLKQNLDKELDEKRNTAKLQQYYLESLPIMQDQFFVSLLEGKIESRQIKGYLENFRLETIQSDCYAVTVFHVDMRAEGNHIEGWNANPMLLNVSLQKLIEENMGKEWQVRIVNYLRSTIMLTMMKRPEDIKKLTDALDRMCKMACRILKVRISAGIGHVCKELSGLKDSYEGALEALEYRTLYRENQAIFIEEIEPRSYEERIFDEQEVQQIIRKIKVGEKQELINDIEEFLGCMEKRKISLQQFRLAVMLTVTELAKLGNSYEMYLEDIFGSGILQKTLQFDSIDVFGQWFLEVCLKIRHAIRKERTDSTKLLIEKAENYLVQHYDDQNMSIDTICSYLNVSAAYFSTLFKRETCKTVVKYLTDLRMEKAVELLNTTEDKTYVIAEKVGYSEPNYFSYVFKKKYGVSPSRYRGVKDGEK